MSRLKGVLVLALLARPATAAERDERVTASLETRAGLVEAPFVTPPFPSVSGFATVLTGAAELRLEQAGWLGLRLPISFVRLDFPARAQVSETAFGNVELSWRRPLELDRSRRLALRAGLLLPSAEHGPETALMKNRALALASALNGGQQSWLLTPGVTGLLLETGLEQTRGSFDLHARLALPVLVRVSEASLPPETETHAWGLLPALELGATWWAKPWLGPSLRVGLVSEPFRVQEPMRESARQRRLQLAIDPAVQARFGERVTLGLEASIPVAGNLGGNAWSIALSGQVGF